MEITFDKKTRLETHIEALITAYDKQILILNKPLTTKKADEGGDEEIKMSDGQIETFSKGIGKAAEVADSLFKMIETKITELEQLNKKDDDLEDGEESEEVVTHTSNESITPHPMNQHIDRD